MSDFLFSTTRRDPDVLASALRPWVRPLEVELVERHGPWGSLAVALTPHERLALHATPDALTVVVGTPVVRGAPDGPALIGAGDRRARVHEALARPRSCAESLDGHFAALRIELRGNAGDGVGRGPAGSVVTDRFSFIPVYYAEVDGGLVVGTHVDAAAGAAGRAGRIDLVSAADLCANYTTAWPSTLYEGVLQLEPGAVRSFGASGWTGPAEAYWRPVEAEATSSLDALAERLRLGLLDGVATATAGADRASVLLSGGEDSRTVLAAVPEGVSVRGVIYAEWESREVRVARRVAVLHGAELAVARRSEDHYAGGFWGTARLVGSTAHFVDVHGLGLTVDPPLAGEPVVLGGLSADSLLKSEYAPDGADDRFRSKRLPGLREELLDAVDERRNEFLDWLRQWRPETAEEWMQLWPFSMRKHGGNLEGNRRLFRSWEAFHATAVLDVAAAAPVSYKRRRRLFRRAMRPLLRPTAWVPHTEYRFPYLGPLGNALVLPALAVARGGRALATGEVRVRHRPWPKWRALVASEAMRERESAVDPAGTALAGLFDDSGPGAVAAARADWYALRRLMLAQLGYVLRVHDDATFQP